MSSQHIYHLQCSEEFVDAFVQEVQSLSPYPPEKVEKGWMGIGGDVRVTLRLSPHEAMQSDYLLGLASGYFAAYKIGWSKDVAQAQERFKESQTRYFEAMYRIEELSKIIASLGNELKEVQDND